MNELTVDLLILDALLTHQDPRSGRGDPNVRVDVEEFAFGKLFYLSDGGYSRVYYNIQRASIFLASESTNKVKDRWDKCQSVVRRINTTVNNFVKSNGG